MVLPSHSKSGGSLEKCLLGHKPLEHYHYFLKLPCLPQESLELVHSHHRIFRYIFFYTLKTTNKQTKKCRMRVSPLLFF